MIELDNVYLTLGNTQVLKGVSFRIHKGETGVMLGASGSGKTTILRVILGLYKPDSGRVLIGGEDITQMDEEGLYRVREKMGMVFQGGALFDSLTVGENVGYRLKEKGLPDAEIEERVNSSLRFVGLEDWMDQMPSELSGGMKKRVAIARGIASEPKVLLYDEPTTGLDPLNSHNITNLVNRLRDEQDVASVVVTHDLPAAFRVADRIAFIHEGRIVFLGDKDALIRSSEESVKQFLLHSGYFSNGPKAGAGLAIGSREVK